MYYRMWDRKFVPIDDVDDGTAYAYGFRCVRDEVDVEPPQPDAAQHGVAPRSPSVPARR